MICTVSSAPRRSGKRILSLMVYSSLLSHKKRSELCYENFSPSKKLFKVLDKSGQVGVVFKHFSKAFDLVCHDILLAKLYKYGVHGDLLNWCGHYLTERQKREVVKGEASDWLTVTSGVPQGSLLGPLFFIICINDLPGVISKDSSIAFLADDSKMYRVFNTQEDLTSFQMT